MPYRPPKFKAARPKRPQLERLRGTSTERGYSSRWRRARLRFLATNPLCVHCRGMGRSVIASHVDHIRAVSGPMDELFWDVSNWQPLCAGCHSKKTIREDGGFGRS